MSDIAKMIAIAKKFGGSGASGSAPVVILPEMTLEVVKNGMADIKARWEVDLVPNKAYIVSFNGAEYTCVANPAHAEMELPDGSVVFGGNMPDMGVTNGNSSAPFIAVGWPNSLAGEMGDMCGQVLPMDGTNVFTFSIVDASSGGNAGGGGVVVNALNVEWADDMSGFEATFDGSYAEILAAFNAGNRVVMRVEYTGGDIPDTLFMVPAIAHMRLLETALDQITFRVGNMQVALNNDGKISGEFNA